jgi:tripartite-type tricarboxylate transporter receptor subunit TctC
MRPSNLSFMRIVFFSLFIGFTLSAFAQTYPDKTVRLIVPFPPGGATDVVARALSAKLSPNWKQQLIVENKPGAGGNIGADLVAKSSSDGYTILLSSPAEVAINPSLYSRMPYDASKDLIPVSKVASAPLVLVVNSDSPVKNMNDLVQFIKNKKGAVNFASSGTGGPQHLAGELFKSMANVSMVHIPYKGGAPAITDLLGGQVDLFFAGVPPALPHINSGRLRAIAVTTLKRSPLLPNVPTISESGFPGFNIENWQGVFVPAGTSNNIIQFLATSINTISNDKSYHETLSAQGAVPSPLPPKEFAMFVQQETQKYSKLVKESGAKAD